MSFELSKNFQSLWPTGVADDGTLTSFLVDSAFVFETSGDFVGTHLVAPIAFTSIEVYFYCTADSGTTSSFNIQMRNGQGASGDVDRPETGGSTIGTPGTAVDCNGAANTWVGPFSITGITSTVGDDYFILLENLSGTPGTDNANFAIRAAMDGLGSSSTGAMIHGVSGTDGFMASDPTVSASQFPGLVKFNDGSYIGNVYVEDGASSSGTNWRGNRITFDEDTVVSGLRIIASSGSLDGALVRLYEGSTQRATVTMNRVQAQRATIAPRFDAFTCVGGTAYDFVVQPASSSTVISAYDMGQGTIPADILAGGFYQTTAVEGATPGSFTESTDKAFKVVVIIDSHPAVAGGSGGLITHPAMNGGMNG